jgi:hypothetical protein
MNAIFSEEFVEWDAAEKVTRCSIKLFNYTARPRQYTILATWPEREGVELIEENVEGRREAKGLRKWKLETVHPSESSEISFAIDGLSKGDWTQFDVFFRGAGEIIGAMKLDEKILEEIRREETAEIMAREQMEQQNLELINQDSEEVEGEASQQIEPSIDYAVVASEDLDSIIDLEAEVTKLPTNNEEVEKQNGEVGEKPSDSTQQATDPAKESVKQASQSDDQSPKPAPQPVKKDLFDWSEPQ